MTTTNAAFNNREDHFQVSGHSMGGLVVGCRYCDAIRGFPRVSDSPQMSDENIRIEISKREAGAKSNKCLFGCGRRTSSRDFYHYDSCYLNATREERGRIYQETHVRPIQAHAEAFRKAGFTSETYSRRISR
jgi:hypothetical protein